MISNGTRELGRSVVGEHLIALLVGAAVLLAVATTIPAIIARADATATRSQQRADMPFVVVNAEPAR